MAVKLLDSGMTGYFADTYTFGTDLGRIGYITKRLFRKDGKFYYSKKFRSNFKIDPRILDKPRKLKKYKKPEIIDQVQEQLGILNSIKSEAFKIIDDETVKDIESLESLHPALKNKY